MSKGLNTEKVFISNLFFLILINIIIKPFYFIIDVHVQNIVGDTSYSEYITLLSFVYMFQIIGDAGMRSYNNRIIAEDKSTLKLVLNPSLALNLVLSFIFLCTVMLASYWFGFTTNVDLLFLIVTSQALGLMLLFVRSSISGLGFYKWDSVLSVSDKLLMVIICGVLLYSPFKGFQNFQIEWLVYAQAFSFLLPLIVAYFILFLKKPKKGNSSVSFKSMWFFLKKSLPYAGIIFLMTIYTRIDILMLNWLFPEDSTQVDMYRGGFRVLELFHVVGLLFASLLLPMYASNIKRSIELEKLVALGFNLLFAIAIPISIIFYFYAQDIMDLLYDRSTQDWGTTFSFIILSNIGVAGMYIFSTLHTAAGSTKLLSKIFIIATLGNIVGNYYLITHFKAEGAAIMTLITQGYIMFTLIYFAYKRYLTYKFHYHFIRMLIYFVLISCISCLVKHYLPVSYLIHFVALSFVSVVLVFLLKIISLKQIKLLFNK